jgi:hypothetical protein
VGERLGRGGGRLGAFSSRRRSRARRAFSPSSEVVSVEGLVFQRSSSTGRDSGFRSLRFEGLLLS